MDTRILLADADPALDSHSYTPERQRQTVDHILARDASPVLPLEPIHHSGRYRFTIPLSAAAALLLATGGIIAAMHSDPATDSTPAAADGVTQRLNDIAQVAAVHSNVSVGKDQYVYSRSVEAGAEMTRQADGTYVAGPLPAVTSRETWSPEDPTKKGLYREGTSATAINPELGGPSSADLSYGQISKLPTDPAALLQQVRDDLPAGYESDKDGGAFTVLLGYLGEAPPPAVAAALYRAAGLIPGVQVTDNAVDALGRPGVGLFRDSSVGNLRDQFIVDPATATYLGHDQYLAQVGPASAAGRLVGTEALLETGVVTQIGHRPERVTP